MDRQLPNILIIICHDLGQQLGSYGDPSLRTRNLDRLAEEGVRFENHFCTTPLCSPSRGSIITGRYPHTNGLIGLTHRGFDLGDGEVTMAHLLKAQGYGTHLFGMEHEAREPDIAKLGYEFTHREKRPFRCAIVTPVFLEFLKACTGKEERPFFAMTGYTEVHRRFDREEYTPDNPKEVFIPPYLPDTPEVRLDIAQFHGLIHAVDGCVGEILKVLEEEGLAENTWVIFTTDHGIAFPRAKSTLYDPGIKTALIMRWPKGLPAFGGAPEAPKGFAGGKAYQELISNIDLLPTILEAVGASIPENIEGKSFLALLQGREYSSREEIFAEKTYHDIYDPIRAIRTSRFKYIRSFEKMPDLPLPSDIRKSLSARSIPVRFKGERAPVELYHLEADPNEMNNLAGNPEYAEIEKELSARLTKWLEDTNDPILKGPVPAPPGARTD